MAWVAHSRRSVWFLSNASGCGSGRAAPKTAQALPLYARNVFLSAAGHSNTEVGRRHVALATVGKWRQRFARHCLEDEKLLQLACLYHPECIAESLQYFPPAGVSSREGFRREKPADVV